MVKHVGRRKEMPPPDKERPPVDDRGTDLEIIEQLLRLALEAITRKTPEVKLADVLKLLEFKHQLKPQVDARKVFWEWIDRFRREASEGERVCGESQARPEESKEQYDKGT